MILRGLAFVVLACVATPGLWAYIRIAADIPAAVVSVDRTAAINTLAVAMLSMLVCVVGGASLAFVLERTRLPLRRPALALLTIPLVMPPAIVAISFHTALGSASDWVWTATSLFKRPLIAAVLLTTLCHLPLVVWLLIAGLRNSSAMAERHAGLYLPWHLVVWHIVLPERRYELAAAALLVFLLSMQSFDICNVVGLDTLMNDIYVAASSLQPSEAVLRVAAPVSLLGLIGALALAYVGELTFHRVVDRFETDRFQLALPMPHRVLAGMIVVFALLGPAAVVWNILAASGGPSRVAASWADGARDLVHSSTLAVASLATLNVLGAALIPALLHPSRTWRRIGFFVLALTFVVPASVQSFAVLDVMDRIGTPGLAEWFNGRPRIVLVLALRYLFPFVLILAIGCSYQHRRAERLRRVFGVRGLAAVFRIRWPALFPYVLTANVLVFVLSMRELELYILHAPPGVSTLIVRVFNALHFGNPEQTAGLCLLQVCGAASPLLLLTVARRRESR